MEKRDCSRARIYVSVVRVYQVVYSVLLSRGDTKWKKFPRGVHTVISKSLAFRNRRVAGTRSRSKKKTSLEDTENPSESSCSCLISSKFRDEPGFQAFV